MYREHFKKLIELQKQRVENMKSQGDFVSYDKLDELIIGVCGGDGIGPAITGQAQRVLEHVLSDEIADGRVKFRTIDNLTIEYRAKVGKAIPDDILAELKKCHVILKGRQPLQRRALGRTRKRKRRDAQGARPVCQRPL